MKKLSYAAVCAGTLVAAMLLRPAVAEEADALEHGYVDSHGVKIHYVSLGEGPLLVLVHGFPDYWYTWRKQIPVLARHFRVVAIDQRGYNKSDQPEHVQDYAMDKLVGDVRAVVAHFGAKKATIVGHDWGGAVAWTFAMLHPDLTERLIILNLPHPYGLRRELANNPAQREASAYARRFQADDAASQLTAAGLAAWVRDPQARERYVEAFERSSFDGMLHYYKANYPTEPYTDAGETRVRVQCPVLMIHGLQDTALLPGALNDTWKWIDGDLTLVTLPDAGHFVQQDAAETVTRTMAAWLKLKAGSE